MSPEEQLFMTLVQMRLGLKELDLAFRFQVDPLAVSRYTTRWIDFIQANGHLSNLTELAGQPLNVAASGINNKK